ncbi:MAG: hypothetical protein K1X67_19975 [Fimbriimonadaceae bacterium]|nr:hypothetical protein [Fimbriimonadaceae bacterium]
MKAIAKTLGLLALVTATVGTVWAQPGTTKDSAPFTSEAKQQVLDDMTRILTTRAYVPGHDFNKWNEMLTKRKEAIDKSKTPGEFAMVINQAFNEFGFSHITLATPEANQAMRERKMVGLGVRIATIEEGVRLEYVFEKSGAADAGLVVGDTIIEVNGEKPRGREAFVGDEGTKVKIKVKRADGSVKDFEVTRKSFSTVLPETLAWPEKDVAVLTIPDFMTYSMPRVDDLIKEANGKAKLLIVDLRGNGGGRVLFLQHLAGRLFPRGQAMGTFINRSTVEKYVKEKGGKETDLKAIAEFSQDKVLGIRSENSPVFTGQVACLVNGGSGSASEMMAAGIRELNGGVIVGTKSAGAVLASLMQPISNGFMLQYPFQDYVTIKGLRLEGNGVVPDIEAPTPGPGQPDKAVTSAIEWFRKKDAAAKKN